MMLCMISYYEQDYVVVLAPFPNNPNPVQSFNVKTDFDSQGDGLVWYARPQLFFNYTLCPTGVTGFSDSHKEVSLVYFSTSCSRLAYPCSMIGPATRACPASTSAPWPTYLGAPPSFRASSAATNTRQFHTASGTISALDMLLQIHSATGATVAGSTR